MFENRLSASSRYSDVLNRGFLKPPFNNFIHFITHQTTHLQRCYFCFRVQRYAFFSKLPNNCLNIILNSDLTYVSDTLKMGVECNWFEKSDVEK